MTSILVIVCLTLFYTFEGGMTAVIWTDVVQMFLYVAGAALSFWVILHQIPGGWAHVAAAAAAGHKFQVFDFRFAWTPEFFSRSYSFWAGLIGGCFLTTASHGTEQLLVQRLLAAKTESQSRAALLSSWIVIFFQFALFLLIGLLLFVHYSDARLPAPQPADSIYPGFIWNNLPTGIAGLVIAAILAAGMSNLSAALNALASTTVMDFYKPFITRSNALRDPNRSDAHFLGVARWATVAWGAVLFLIGLVARHVGIGARSGSYDRVYLIWIAPGRVPARLANQARPADIGHDRDDRGVGPDDLRSLWTRIAFTWYVVIGTGATFFTGYAISLFLKEPKHERTAGSPINIDLKRELGVWSAAAIVVGTVIGSGIFLVPSPMVRNVGSPLMVFVVWIVGGLLSLFGALSYAELAAAMPEAGGEYVYLREAYGPLWAFIYGWTQTWVAKSGSIATLATGFFIYLANFRPELGQVWIVTPLPLGDGGAPLEIRYGQLLAMGVIVLLALINYYGVRVGGNVQVAVTLVKVGLIAAIIVIGLGSHLGSTANYHSSVTRAGRYFGIFRRAGGCFVGLRRLEQRDHGGVRDPAAAAQLAARAYRRDAQRSSPFICWQISRISTFCRLPRSPLPIASRLK